MSVLSWLAKNLDDPSRGMHALGFLLLLGEAVHHWSSHAAFDIGLASAAAACFAAGVASDRLGALPRVSK